MMKYENSFIKNKMKQQACAIWQFLDDGKTINNDTLNRKCFFGKLLAIVAKMWNRVYIEIKQKYALAVF